MNVLFLKDVKTRDNECGASFYAGKVYKVSVSSNHGDIEPIWVALNCISKMEDPLKPIHQSIYPRLFREFLKDGTCIIIKDKN